MKRKKLVVLLALVGVSLCSCQKSTPATQTVTEASEETTFTEQESIAELTQTDEDITESSEVEESEEQTIEFETQIKYVIEEVTVRESSTEESDGICSLDINTEVEVIGLSDDEKWYKLAHNEVEGFVPIESLGDEMIEVSESAESPAKNSTSSQASTSKKEEAVTQTSQDSQTAQSSGGGSTPQLPPNATLQDKLRYAAEASGGYVNNDMETHVGGQTELPPDAPDLNWE